MHEHDERALFAELSAARTLIDALLAEALWNMSAARRATFIDGLRGALGKTQIPATQSDAAAEEMSDVAVRAQQRIDLVLDRALAAVERAQTSL